jgi:hypothetical protein
MIQQPVKPGLPDVQPNLAAGRGLTAVCPRAMFERRSGNGGVGKTPLNPSVTSSGDKIKLFEFF